MYKRQPYGIMHYLAASVPQAEPSVSVQKAGPLSGRSLRFDIEHLFKVSNNPSLVPELASPIVRQGQGSSFTCDQIFIDWD